MNINGFVGWHMSDLYHDSEESSSQEEELNANLTPTNTPDQKDKGKENISSNAIWSNIHYKRNHL